MSSTTAAGPVALDAEALVAEVLERPEVTAAVQNATFRFTVLLGDDIPPSARDTLGQTMREWATRQVRLALHSDPSHPRVLRDLLRPPVGGRPGSRGPAAADDPDETWSVVAVDGRSSLRVTLGEPGARIGNCTVLVTSNLSQTLNGSPATVVARLDPNAMRTADDGTALLTVGPGPADGRPNHLTTTVDARYLLIREHTADWAATSTAISVERTDPPAREPLDLERIAALGARFIIDDVGNGYPIRRLERARPLSDEQLKSAGARYGSARRADDYWLPQMFGALDDGSLSAPSAGAVGPGRQVIRGRLALAEDQAFVLRVDPGGAPHWSVTAYDPWLMTTDAATRPVSRNRTQTVTDPDGGATYILSALDTGAANWIDTSGHDESLLVIAIESPTGEPGAHGEVVALSGLPTGPVDAEARAGELARRSEAYLARFDADRSSTHG